MNFFVGDAVHEVDAVTGRIMYDLDMGTVVAVHWNEDLAVLQYSVRWDGSASPDSYLYSSRELERVLQ